MCGSSGCGPRWRSRFWMPACHLTGHRSTMGQNERPIRRRMLPASLSCGRKRSVQSALTLSAQSAPCTGNVQRSIIASPLRSFASFAHSRMLVASARIRRWPIGAVASGSSIHRSCHGFPRRRRRLWRRLSPRRRICTREYCSALRRSGITPRRSCCVRWLTTPDGKGARASSVDRATSAGRPETYAVMVSARRRHPIGDTPFGGGDDGRAQFLG